MAPIVGDRARAVQDLSNTATCRLVAHAAPRRLVHEASGLKRMMEADLARHKFKVGQLVDSVSPRSGVPTAGRQYEIVRLLPVENGNVLYRVKSKGESFERVAKEGELSRRGPV